MLECLLAYAESGVLDDLHADGWPRSPLAVAASLGRQPMMDLNWTVIHSACESGKWFVGILRYPILGLVFLKERQSPGGICIGRRKYCKIFF